MHVQENNPLRFKKKYKNNLLTSKKLFVNISNNTNQILKYKKARKTRKWVS